MISSWKRFCVWNFRPGKLPSKKTASGTMSTVEVASVFQRHPWKSRFGGEVKLSTTWRIIPFSKWLITMVSRFPK